MNLGCSPSPPVSTGTIGGPLQPRPRKHFDPSCAMTLRLPAALLLCSLALLTGANAEEYTVRSGPARTHLVELFTSEGCSSCPPAEAWLSKLKDESRLWRDFVPVAFHVDYWD